MPLLHDWYDVVQHITKTPIMNTAVNSVTRKKLPALIRLVNDMKASARAVSLVYVSDAVPGITRIKKGKGYSYSYNGQRVTDKATLQRIRSLVIPPAWKNVWICPDEKGHLQVTGYDARNRKQYKYHANWNAVRNHTKFANMLEFGESLPQIRMQLAKDISQAEMCERKVIALVISIMDQTYIRIGNSCYEKENGSHGLTTMKDKHVNIDGHSITFSFKGKKGIYHEISIKNKKLARLVKQCRDIPGKELFQYITKDGEKRCIDSGMVNNYIKEITRKQFTAKDFRTWAGSLNALRKLSETEPAQNQAQLKRNLNTVFDYVSSKLGNTRAVCKKYYVHPLLTSLYENNGLPDMKNSGMNEDSEWLSFEEMVMLDLFRKQSKTTQLVLSR